MPLKRPISNNFPTTHEVRDKLCDALRDVGLLRGLLRLAERAERYRERDREEGVEAVKRRRRAS